MSAHAPTNLAALETRRLTLQNELDGEKTADERNRLGQFATPPALADEIACYAVGLMESGVPVHFEEPALGSGAFFSALLRALPAKRIARAVGFELDPRFARVAHALWSDTRLRTIEGDYTDPAVRACSGFRPTLILTNPPYVRHHHLQRDTKARLQAQALATTGLKVNGLAGLYAYFFLIATARLELKGVAAWLIPSEFMDVNYGEVLRRYLTERVTLVRIHRFNPQEVQFGDALVTSTVVVVRQRLPSTDTSVLFTYGGSLLAPQREQVVSLAELRRAHKWSTYPRIDTILQPGRDKDSTPRLGDFFKIQRGIATGANEFFILPRRDAWRRKLPEACLRPILPSPRNLRQTIIERDSDGYPHLPDQLALIDCYLSEEELRQRHPALWTYLQTATVAGLRDRYLIRQRKPWYKQEQRPRAPFLCTYMGRGTKDRSPFRFIWNRSDATATNLYLVLYPINALASVLMRDPGQEAVVFEILQSITRDELREENRVYGGGLQKIEPGELARVTAADFLTRMPELHNLLTSDRDKASQIRLFS